MKTQVWKTFPSARTLRPPTFGQVQRLENKRPDHLAQTKLIEGMMQRKVGLEFQTKANLWIQPERDEEQGWERDIDVESAPVIQGRRKLLYGDKVFNLEGLFHIESDDGEVEFVSEPFEEDQQGYDMLTLAVSLMAEMANLIFYNPTETFATVAEQFGAGTHDSKRVQEGEEYPVYVGNIKNPDDTPDLTASPQATIGVRLDKIVEMFEKVLAKRELSSFGRWSDRENPHLPLHRSQQVLKQVLKQGLERFEIIKTHPVNNFSFLVRSYLMSAKEYSPDLKDPKNYPKIAFPIMARNSFKSIFNGLAQEDQEWFTRHKLTFVKMAERVLEEPLFTAGYFDDRGVFHSPDSVLKVGEWLDSITAEGTTPDKLSALPGMMRGRGLGAVPALDEVRKIDQRGTPIAPSKGVLFELRRLMTNVPPDEWVKLAQLVHQTMNEINEAEVYEETTIDIAQQTEHIKGTDGSTEGNLNEHPVTGSYYE